MHAWSFLALAVSALALAACGGSTPAATPATSTAAAASAKPAASVAASASPAASAPASASAKPAASGAGGLVTVKVGNSSASPTNGGEYVANGLGFFEKQGIKIEHVTFNAASAVAPALATGEVDVADVGVNPAMFNTMAAALGAKVVADKRYAPPGFGSASVLVRKDLADKVKGPADF